MIAFLESIKDQFQMKICDPISYGVATVFKKPAKVEDDSADSSEEDSRDSEEEYDLDGFVVEDGEVEDGAEPWSDEEDAMEVDSRKRKRVTHTEAMRKLRKMF